MKDWEKRYFTLKMDLRKALIDLPEVAPIEVLLILDGAGEFTQDWSAGKELQMKHGLDVVPPNCECEVGAGVWKRLREGMIASTMAKLSQPKN